MSVSMIGIEKRIDDFHLQLDLKIQSGELLCLLGPSGCGKSTTLRIVSGLLTPDAGRIVLGNKDITATPAHERNVAMVFQNHALFPHMDVKDNIAYGLRVRKAGKQRIRERVDHLLDLVHLSGYEKRKIDTLSGGEQQRVALARALAVKPDLLLFDEPLSALDASLRGMLRKEIKRIQRALGLTAVYVTHDQGEALSLGDTIAVMRGGCIEQRGTPEELYHSPKNLFVASFIGRSNTVIGTVRSVSGLNVLAKTPFGDISAVLTKDVRVRPGGKVTLFFRPEHVECVNDGSSQGLLKGKCLEAEFQGEFYRVQLGAGNQSIRINASPAYLNDSGQEMRFRVPEDKVLIFS